MLLVLLAAQLCVQLRPLSTWMQPTEHSTARCEHQATKDETVLSEHHVEQLNLSCCRLSVSTHGATSTISSRALSIIGNLEQ